MAGWGTAAALGELPLTAAKAARESRSGRPRATIAKIGARALGVIAGPSESAYASRVLGGVARAGQADRDREGRALTSVVGGVRHFGRAGQRHLRLRARRDVDRLGK